MAEILVFSERESVAFELLNPACSMGTAAVVLLGKTDAQAYFAYGATKAYVSDDERVAEFNADVYADALCQIVNASGATTVLLGSTKRGKEVAGRLAQRLGCGAVMDATRLTTENGAIKIQRYALGGNTVATEVIKTDRQVIAVMPRTFEARPAGQSVSPTSGQVARMELKLREPRVITVERRPKVTKAANIEAAETLVAIGKGLAKQEDLVLVEQLAHALKGEIGCTRALASDYHWLSEEQMIGISGKICKPRLLVSLGISGQIQHTVGISGSKWILAINKDKNAPIFKSADFGIVADLYQVVPQLIERIAAG